MRQARDRMFCRSEASSRYSAPIRCASVSRRRRGRSFMTSELHPSWSGKCNCSRTSARNCPKALRGGLVPFGGHKGYGLSFAVQALGLLAGAGLAQSKVKDYGFLLLVIDPKLTLPGGEFPDHMAELVDKIKATPRRPGVDEIRVPSERSFRERERRRIEGLVFDRKVVDSLNAL